MQKRRSSLSSCYDSGAHAQVRYTVVCLSVCVECYSCSKINEEFLQAFSHVFLDCSLWICMYYNTVNTIAYPDRIQCEKLLGLAGETPKSMETRNPARAELQSVTT